MKDVMCMEDTIGGMLRASKQPVIPKPKPDLKRLRAELFLGMYDGSAGRSSPQVRSQFGCSGTRKNVRLLNPDVGEVDATSRRFSLLEID